MHLWLAPSAFAPHLGGVEELTAKLGKHLRGRGHEVLVVTHRWPPELSERESVKGLTVVREAFPLPTRHPRSWLAYRAGAAQVQQRLSRLPRPDLVHVQCPSSQTPHLVRYAREIKVPLILTTQGETYMDADGLYLRSPFARRNLRQAAVAASALTACSAHAAVGASVYAPAFARATVVPNGIDAEDWADLSPVDAPVIGAWGRHVSQKGFDLLLRAFAHLRMQRPDARLLLGGSGPESARLHGDAGPGVSFLGPLDRSGVRSLLARCAVVAVPSRIEPFGIVALEALAAGRGLVYSPHGGLGEAAGGLGRRADPYNSGAFAEAMAQELDQPTPPSAAVRHLVPFSWPHVTDSYLEIYRQALAVDGGCWS